MANAKGGRKLKRGTKRRARTAIQVARTLKNKHTRAARRTRRKEYWNTTEGIERKNQKAYARRMKKVKPVKQALPLLDNINAPSPLDVPPPYNHEAANKVMNAILGPVANDGHLLKLGGFLP